MRQLLFIVLFPIAIFSQINQLTIDKKTEKPMLIGKCNVDAFADTNFSWWWNSEYDFYEVNEDSVNFAELSNLINGVKVKIIMGTWCSDSRREVPHLYKIFEILEFPKDNIDLINVDRDKLAGNLDISEYKVEHVPTIIFYKNQIELGRIIEAPEKETLEEDMMDILSNK